MGARAFALGNTTSCIEDEWSTFNNIAGLAAVENTTASFSYHAYPTFKSFNRTAATIALPVRFGVFGAGAFRFGDKLYNEHIFSAGISNEFGIASLGAKVNYIQYQAEGFGSVGVFTASMGGIATLTKQLSIGAYINNINQPEIVKSGEVESVPTILNLGIAFKPSDKVFLSTEVEKSLQDDLLWRSGLEYQAHRKFFLRTGFNVNPDTGYFGFGFRPKRLSVDYALAYHSKFGVSHQASIGYRVVR